jgi:hypothetical protein
MRPLPSVVIDCGAELTLRLESGGQVRIPKQKDLRLGDTAYVLYDYTQLVVRDVWTKAEYEVEENWGEELDHNLPPDYEEPHRWAIEPELALVVSL